MGSCWNEDVEKYVVEKYAADRKWEEKSNYSAAVGTIDVYWFTLWSPYA